MIYYYDLHIHSCLSACADVLMSPNNIFNMAHLKGLDIISITDHNSIKQYEVLKEIALSYDMLLIFGIEVSTIEDVHVLIYFKSFEQAKQFDRILNDYRDYRFYDEYKYGEQVITDIEDQEVEKVPYLLSRPLQISIFNLDDILKDFECIKILAHLDRMKHSAISYIKDISFDAIELSVYTSSKAFIEKHDLKTYKCLFNSDAHQLVDILEKQEKNQMELESLSIEAFFSYFKNG